MDKKTVTIGIANGPITNMEVETLKEWKPIKVSQFKDTIYFKHDGLFYTMKTEDYNKIFN